MTTPKTTFAGLALIAALCGGFTLGLTACTDERARTGAETPPAETPPAEADLSAGFAAYRRGDYATALSEWRPLAEQGHAKAQNNLGLMYRNGEGVPQDDAEAVGWWRKAAEQGYATAQHNLGVMYGKGLGVPQDEAQAYMWFKLSSSTFPPGEDRDQSVKNRDIVAGRMTPAQIAEAQKLAREWTPKKFWWQFWR